MPNGGNRRPVLAWYREFRPSEALADDVHAFFSFVAEPIVPSVRALICETAFPDATFCSPRDGK